MNKNRQLPLLITLLSVTTFSTHAQDAAQNLKEKAENAASAVAIVGAQVTDFIGGKAHEAKEAVTKGVLAAKIGIEQAKVSYETHRAEKAERQAATYKTHITGLEKEIDTLKEIIRTYDHEVTALKDRVTELNRTVASLKIEHDEIAIKKAE